MAMVKACWILAACGLGLILLYGRYPLLRQNIAFLQLNWATARPSLSANQRHTLLQNVSTSTSTWQISAQTAQEQRRNAQTYLEQQPAWAGWSVGVQWLGTVPLIDEAGQWSAHKTTDMATNETAVTLHHRGPSYSAISQTVTLPAGQCYLFSTTAVVRRADHLPTYWLYWAIPAQSGLSHPAQEQSLIVNHGSQAWQTYKAVFCLDGEADSTIPVTLAPVLVYGQATATLQEVVLFQLQEAP